MLSMSDTNINLFFSTFAELGIPVAFLVPTCTGMEKSIMDATAPIRDLLLSAQIHDYNSQLQGSKYKVMINTYFATPHGLKQTQTSLYRPITKQGDPRLWIYGLRNYCLPYNLLALICLNQEIIVFNLSDSWIQNSLLYKGDCYNFLKNNCNDNSSIANELLHKLHLIHQQGFIPSITTGDSGVGDTLENALGIPRNNRKTPDYKGIELKTTRLSRNGQPRHSTRSTLFTKVPDIGLSYREIIDNYGKKQTPKNSTIARLQLYDTLKCSRPNAYDLILDIDNNNGLLNIVYQQNTKKIYVSGWYLKNLQKTLKTKHKETFWIGAESKFINNREYFRYNIVYHTKGPNVSLLAPLLESDKITIDLAAHYKPNGQWRDHGVLFKMRPNDIPLLMGEPKEYIL